MREDKSFFRQVAMQEILCPVGSENCTSLVSASDRSSLLAMHKTMPDLFACIGGRLYRYHLNWITNDAARIKLDNRFGAERMTEIGRKAQGTPLGPLLMAFQRVAERLAYHRYNQPWEVEDMASREFGDIWKIVLELLP